MIGEVAKANVTIYLPADVLQRCRDAAAAERRTLSNYLSGLLERAHPAQGQTYDLVLASREAPAVDQGQLEDAIAAIVERGPMQTPKQRATVARIAARHKRVTARAASKKK